MQKEMSLDEAVYVYFIHAIPLVCASNLIPEQELKLRLF